MRRRQPFALSSLASCPEILRSSVTGYLQVSTQMFQPFCRKLGLLQRAMKATGTNRIVDLCSGSGGPWLHLVDHLNCEDGHPVEIVLTDRLPPADAVARINSTGRMIYRSESVDATAVPEDLQGLRTIFNGLHLFRPESARAILQDAVRHGQPIAVFESLRRSWVYLLLGLLTPLYVLLLTPWMRPVRMARLFWTYVVPIAPLVVLWDATAALFGCYTPDELLAMTASLDGGPYDWEAGTYIHRGVPVTYLVGCPRKESTCEKKEVKLASR